MASNYTTNYNLCQWQPTDQVQRTDFNADNAKIDAALAELSPSAALADRALPNLAFYIGQFAILDAIQRGRYITQKTMLYEIFRDESRYTITSPGGMDSITSTGFKLTGAGNTAHIVADNRALHLDDWTRVHLWLHIMGGEVTVSLDGKPMTRIRSNYTTTVQGYTSYEREFFLETTGRSGAQFVLDVTCGEDGELNLYDYCAFFF